MIEGLGAEVGAEISGEVGKGIEGGVGVMQPAEDQGLDKGGAAELAGAPDAAGVAGGLFGLGGQKGLQGGGQVGKNTHGEPLRTDGSVATAILELRGSFSCASLS